MSTPYQADFGCRMLEVDFCTAPEAKILLSNLTWVRADAVPVGAELLAFDEVPKGHQHSFRAAHVLAVKHLRRPRVRVRTTHGTTVVSAEHRLLARQHKMARRWVHAADLRPGMQLAFLAEPWEPDTSWDGGWLAGFFDGEGWVSSVKVGYAQNTGPTLDRVQALLTERNFEFWVTNNSSTAQCAITNGIRETLRFLGVIRPTRLLPKARGTWEGRRTWGKQSPICRVISVEVLDEGAVVALETTTKTYISDGFFSHNCAIEAKLTGWLCQDPEFMRLAALGIHGALVTHILGDPYDPTWADADLKARFKAAKQANTLLYDRAKHAVYGDLYGQTEYGMMQSFPAEFPTLKVAKEYKRVLHQMAPTVPQFQQDVRQIAYDLNYLGGPTPPAVYSHQVAQVFARNPNLKQHPFGYKHWFWSILGFRKIPYNVYLKRQKAGEPVTVIQGDYCAITLGTDAKRVVAFFPQSIAAGILKEALLRLFTPGLPNYIGTAYYGRTPLRAPIHDSGLFEVPVRVWDRVLEAVITEFTRPIPQLRLDWMTLADKARMGLGDCLSIGVAAKAGPDWGSMTDIHLSAGVGELAAERVKFAEESGEAEEDAFDLGTAVA